MPAFFQRFRRKPKDDPAAAEFQRNVLSKTGIEYDSCSANGSLREYVTMPLPPPRRPVTPTEGDLARASPQTQSALFSRLPVEIRQQIYAELFGQRAVHIEYDFGYAPGCRGREKKPADQWRWWHRVCDEEDPKPGDMCRTDDLDDLKRVGRRELQKYKLKGVDWLRTCRLGYEEALPILYGTNIFLISSYVKLCRLPKLIVPSHLTAITCLNLLHVVKATTPSTMTDETWSAYATTFRTLRRTFTGLQQLRVVIHILNKSCTPRAGSVPDDPAVEEAWFRPWYDLAMSRQWESLEIGIQASWFQDFETGVERWMSKNCIGKGEVRLPATGIKLVQVEDFTTWDGKLSEVWNSAYL